MRGSWWASSWAGQVKELVNSDSKHKRIQEWAEMSKDFEGAENSAHRGKEQNWMGFQRHTVQDFIQSGYIV